jgi:hypothetical protein
MKYQVDGWNNFCRVFELPEHFPKGYCFGGGLPTNFQMVDWFNPIPQMPLSGKSTGEWLPNPAVSKEVWKEKVGEIKTIEVDHEKLSDDLTSWLKKKTYMKPGRKYLVVCNFGMCFMFSAD